MQISRTTMNLSADLRPVHAIDAFNRIVAVSPGWLGFMRTLAGRELNLDEVIGRPLWDLLPGTQVRQLWEILFERVRAVGAPVFVPMRADTPSQRRVLDVELHSMPERAIR